MSDRRSNIIAVGAAAGAVLAVGLIPGPVAHATPDGDGISILPPSPDADFMSGPLQNFGLFSTQGFADPDEHFDALVLSGSGFTDVLTSGIDPADHLATLLPDLGLPPDVTAGTVDVTVNTFISSTDPALDSSFTIPFTDPLIELWIALLPFGF